MQIHKDSVNQHNTCSLIPANTDRLESQIFHSQTNLIKASMSFSLILTIQNEFLSTQLKRHLMPPNNF